MSSRITIMSVVILLVSLAGCGYVPQSTSHSVTYAGTVERVDGTLRIDGEVQIHSGAEPNRTFQDVTIVFYNSPGDVVDRVYLGDMSSNATNAPAYRAVNVTVEPASKYIYIESPNFWTEKSRPVVAFRWTGDEYDRYAIESEDEKF